MSGKRHGLTVQLVVCRTGILQRSPVSLLNMKISSRHNASLNARAQGDAKARWIAVKVNSRPMSSTIYCLFKYSDNEST